ncbi:MAG: HAMP domain-containing protein [Acidobacteriota bacterium]|nr:MAG: HAMP domain-containing protein [Acidobacteriota bacterium]
MLARLLKNLSSFRIELIAFITLMLLITALVISFINQRLERRTTGQVDEYFRSIIQATDIGYRSLSEGKYLFTLVNTGQPGSLAVDDKSIIRHILVIDAETGKISDSTDQDDIGQSYQIGTLPIFQPGNVKLDTDEAGQQDSRTVKFSIETDKGKRDILAVISMQRLRGAKEVAERDRLLAFVVLGLLLILAIAVFSRRFTEPISELGEAAQKVAAGNLDFKVPVAGPEEISRLTTTFNEMLAGLRNTRQLEDQLQRAERSAVVGRLASGIAHEIRNPLNFINLSIDHLREKFAPQPEPDRREYTHILTTIKDEIARLNRLVSDFLSYGRPAKLKLREIDSRALIEEVRSLVSAKSALQNVRINIAQNGGSDARLMADPEQLKTCFSNLMINAVQAMPDGGSLDIDLKSSPDTVEIDFSDSGPGIEADAIEQVFEPYYSTKETGIGLGLPLTRKIIEEHGGEITVSSEPGRGTTFTVRLRRNGVGSKK